MTMRPEFGDIFHCSACNEPFFLSQRQIDGVWNVHCTECEFNEPWAHDSAGNNLIPDIFLKLHFYRGNVNDLPYDAHGERRPDDWPYRWQRRDDLPQNDPGWRA